MADVNFAIVQIFNEQDDALNNLCVIVPVHYISQDKNKQMYVRYLKGPYTPDDINIINQITKERDLSAPENWQFFKCVVQRFCSTYEEAELYLESETNMTNKSDEKKDDTEKSNDKEPVFLITTLNNDSISKKSNENCNIETLETAEVITEDAAFTQDVSSNNKSFDKSSALVDITCTMITKQDLLEMKNALISHINIKFTELKNTIVNQVDKKLSHLDHKIINAQKDIEEIKTFTMENRRFKEDENIITLDKLSEMYDYTFPIKTPEEFKIFDNQIKKRVFTDLKTHLIATTNTNYDLLRICTIIFKNFFTRHVLMQYTAKKKSRDKDIFKDTRFYVCLKESLMHAFAPKQIIIDDLKLLQAIAAVINNSIDWDGCRSKRQKLTHVTLDNTVENAKC